jgi:FAD/FMN-containing dehydrogenase
VHVGGVRDVQECINFARSSGVRVAVTNAGAHSTHANEDNALLINLNRMRSVDVDAVRKTVRAEGGCVLGDVDHATAPYNIHVPAGTISHTGLVGLTLGGGIGWLTKKAGLTLDNVIEYELVLADGRFVKVNSSNEYADLMFGMRGAGFNFGVVTALTYQAVDVSAQIVTGPLFFPFSMAKQVLAAYSALN